MKYSRVKMMKEYLEGKGYTPDQLNILELDQVEELFNEEKRNVYWTAGPTF